MLTKTNVY